MEDDDTLRWACGPAMRATCRFLDRLEALGRFPSAGLRRPGRRRGRRRGAADDARRAGRSGQTTDALAERFGEIDALSGVQAYLAHRRGRDYDALERLRELPATPNVLALHALPAGGGTSTPPASLRGLTHAAATSIAAGLTLVRRREPLDPRDQRRPGPPTAGDRGADQVARGADEHVHACSRRRSPRRARPATCAAPARLRVRAAATVEHGARKAAEKAARDVLGRALDRIAGAGRDRRRGLASSGATDVTTDVPSPPSRPTASPARRADGGRDLRAAVARDPAAAVGGRRAGPPSSRAAATSCSRRATP